MKLPITFKLLISLTVKFLILLTALTEFIILRFENCFARRKPLKIQSVEKGAWTFINSRKKGKKWIICKIKMIRGTILLFVVYRIILFLLYYYIIIIILLLLYYYVSIRCRRCRCRCWNDPARWGAIVFAGSFNYANDSPAVLLFRRSFSPTLRTLVDVNNLNGEKVNTEGTRLHFRGRASDKGELWRPKLPFLSRCLACQDSASQRNIASAWLPCITLVSRLSLISVFRVSPLF